jgi:TRAP-type transport system periplasmic protein
MTVIHRLGRAFALSSIAALMAAAPALAEQTLKFATTLPEGNPLVEQVFQPWVEGVNERGKGVLQIEMINGPTIASAANVYDRVNSGIIDMGWVIMGSSGAPFPQSEVAALPFLANDPSLASNAMWALYKDGMFAEDFADTPLVALVALPSAGLHSNVPIASAADLQGKKIRVADKISAQMLTALGATPISIATADTYQAVETGVVDGAYTGWAGVVLFKLEEVTAEHLDEDLGSGAAGIFINQDVMAGLDDQAKAILAESGDILVKDLGTWYVKIDGVFRDKVVAQGGKLNNLSPEELARWKEATNPIIDAWAAETSNGAAILARFRELMAGG